MSQCRIQTWTHNASDQHVCTEDFLQTLSQERNLKESLLASFRRAPWVTVPCKIRSRIRFARSRYGEEVCIPSAKATSSSNRDGDGNHIYNELLLGLTLKETATLQRIRIFVGNCAYRFRGKYFLGDESKAFVRLSRLAFDCWLVTQTKNSRLLEGGHHDPNHCYTTKQRANG
jgi:hypothetical protein